MRANTTTLNITFTGVSGEVGAGTDAEGDIVAVGNAKGSLFGIDATVLGRYDSGDGATAAVRTDLLSAKGGLGYVWGYHGFSGIGKWLTYYNSERPHSTHGILTPDEAYVSKQNQLDWQPK